ncbi:mannose-6-phosphate isomerase, class I [Rhodococcus antarcticus]|uniref:mannose-6-phosphate isomerase n=1 Tax=Rhodococcus antarcticus TaxID=2987751 RepID=A0ABY6P342_9NOCA|nr:mannose-6-phosphate isomerase, class I [Rhodococcus antarcticus]UZJ25553.1 mannose-6-phosphate isomerase, class I [Rhodococcus antarcticus]
MQLMTGAVRTYAWGSRTAIAELCGRPVPAPHPEAELWMGAHPADPALVHGPDGARSLLEVLRAEPVAELGERSRAAFGDRLPFLLKVLAADEPLSLQAHPSALQAEQGFADEQRRGIPLDSPVRNYRDASHKPELLCALTRFDALAGFREVSRTVELLAALDGPELAPYTALLSGQPDAGGLRALFTTWITLPRPSLDVLLPAVLDACVDHVRGLGPFAAEARTILELGESYPGDAGVLAALLLNRMTLQPGEAIYLPAGNLHTYLDGVGVEIMANSDNVLRGGLTPKHVDVAELLRVLDFAAGDVPVSSGTTDGGPEHTYPAPAAEFRLSRVDLVAGAAAVLSHDGPQVLLCTAGGAELAADGAVLALPRGSAVWVPAADGPVTVRAGRDGAQVFRARDGLER